MLPTQLSFATPPSNSFPSHERALIIHGSDLSTEGNCLHFWERDSTSTEHPSPHPRPSSRRRPLGTRARMPLLHKAIPGRRGASVHSPSLHPSFPLSLSSPSSPTLSVLRTSLSPTLFLPFFLFYGRKREGSIGGDSHWEEKGKTKRVTGWRGRTARVLCVNTTPSREEETRVCFN